MTKNNKVVLGVAAGVAALAVAGVYAKRKGYLNNINTANLQNKFNGLKETAMNAINGKSNGSNEMNASGANENSGNSMDNFASGDNSSNGGATKRKATTSMKPGDAGNINPATT